MIHVPAVDLSDAARLVVDQHGAAPGAAVGAARFDGGWRLGWGSFGRLEPDGPRLAPDDVFDLASLTKPITALALARAQRHGWLHLTEPLAALLPELAGTPSAGVPLELLACHRAGLAAHIELFVAEPHARQADRATLLRRAATARRPECPGDPPPRGFAPVYSDLGYILLGAALEARSGLSLDALVRREIRDLAVQPEARLGSARQLDGSRFVPTEDVAWRGGVLRGIVHDENAWVLAGRGSAGHAGLFGDAAALVSLGMAVLDALHGRSDAWLTPSDLAPLITPRPGGSHAAGFDTKSGDHPSCGSRFGPRTFGHLGFTGTSIWLDPEAQLLGVLLTNRVHPTRSHLAIRAARPAAYDAIHEAMTAGGPLEGKPS